MRGETGASRPRSRRVRLPISGLFCFLRELSARAAFLLRSVCSQQGQRKPVCQGWPWDRNGQPDALRGCLKTDRCLLLQRCSAALPTATRAGRCGLG